MSESKNIDMVKYRREFPFTKEITFFNHASFGPMPEVSWKATQQYYQGLRLKRVADDDREAFQKLENIRELIAKMIKSKPEEIAFVPNTSYGLNVAAWGLDLKRGDKILLSDVEFPANVYPWTNLKQKGIKTKFIPSKNKCFDIHNFVKAINKRTKVLSISSVQYFNGFGNDLESIGKICEENDIFFVVDGIQGIGAVDLDVKKCKIDLLSGGGQKWLLSSLGTGFFYLSSQAKRKVNLSFFGWMGVDWELDFTDLLKFNLEPFPSARRFEIGTYPYSLLWSMHSSLQLISQIGVKNIEKHNLELLDVLIDYLKDSAYQIKSSLEPKHRSSILSFSGESIRKLYEKLIRNKIMVSFREGVIRVSPHFYNTKEEMNKLIEILK
ncbi:MAG: aminotransferase class V-fold PLP-dependent enzyme [candidate division Zixibacteria bacterium]|nr:aminotransferase class V-fold PLP-dependent enzyme [candidate division Zixibacteria bacterium]